MEEKEKTTELNIEEISLKYKNYRINSISAISMLLGEFDVNGKYYLTREIAHELVTADKTIVVSNEQTYDVFLNAENFNLNLLLRIQESGEDCVATLELIEKLQSVEESFVKKVITFVAVYRDIKDSDFFTKVCKAFNLHPIEEVGAKDILAENCENIYNKLRKRREHLLSLQQDYNGEYKIYIATLLKILENGGEQGQSIILKLRRILAENAVRFSKDSPDYYFKFKILLEQIMANEKFVLNSEQISQLAPLQQKIMDRKAPEVVMAPPKSEQSKGAPEIKPIKKSSSGSTKPFELKEVAGKIGEYKILFETNNVKTDPKPSPVPSKKEQPIQKETKITQQAFFDPLIDQALNQKYTNNTEKTLIDNIMNI